MNGSADHHACERREAKPVHSLQGRQTGQTGARGGTSGSGACEADAECLREQFCSSKCQPVAVAQQSPAEG
eukprot:5067082-Alexandrium_andersonii.AAC.1